MIHPKTLLISRHFYSLESYVWRSIYNLIIDTISTYDILLDRSFLKLWNGIRHVMPSTDRRLELKEKTSMGQNAWQAFVYANGLIELCHFVDVIIWISLYVFYAHFLCFLSCYYYWIFGSPRPTVCKLVFFHLRLASGLHLWKLPLASLQLHLLCPRNATSCTWYLTPGLSNFAQLKGENHTTWFLCL